MLRVRTGITGVIGGPYLNTMYSINTATTLDAQNFSDAVGAFWTAVSSAVSADASWATEAEVAVMDETTGNISQILTVTPTTGAGVAAGNLLSPATQGLVRWRTGQFIGGREIRGRTFIPAATVGSNSDGVPSAAYQTDLQGAADALNAANVAFAIWHRPSPASAGVAHEVISQSVWNKWAVLRSRRD